MKGYSNMKLKTRLFLVLIALLFCVTLVSCKKEPEEPTTEPPDEDYSGSISAPGNNTGSEPPTTTPPDVGNPNEIYYISSASELKEKLKLKGTYILKADIDLAGEEWSPVGSVSAPFEGTFKSEDGQAYTVKNFKITASLKEHEGDISLAFKYSYAGFFGATKNAKIQNVNFDGITINVSSKTDNCVIFAGVVVGYAKNTTVENCNVGITEQSKITVKSEKHSAFAGGVSGHLSASSINNCKSNAAITVQETKNEAYCGGLVGKSYSDSKINKSEAFGSVKASVSFGKAYAGGIIGYCSSTEVTKTSTASTVYAEVTSYSMETGEIGSANAGGFAAIVTAATNKRTVFTERLSISFSPVAKQSLEKSATSVILYVP